MSDEDEGPIAPIRLLIEHGNGVTWSSTHSTFARAIVELAMQVYKYEVKAARVWDDRGDYLRFSRNGDLK